MFKKLLAGLIIPLMAISSFLSAEIEYKVQDIGTLQTHSSEAIAINNQNQILGWYNLDGSKEGKHFFLRDANEDFHEIPGSISGIDVDWKFLTNKGTVYGEYKAGGYTNLFMWDLNNGGVNLGSMPGKEISAVNDQGQVLIKAVSINKEGKSITRPAIWKNGKVTYLKGLEGDLGIESEKSYGFDINNKGEVVGESLTSLVYKNNVYYQVHALKWDVNGHSIDLHYNLPKSSYSSCVGINDNGDILVKIEESAPYSQMGILSENSIFKYNLSTARRINNKSIVYNDLYVCDKNRNTLYNYNFVNHNLKNEKNSIWLKVEEVKYVNDKGEIIADGETIFGEKHAVLLVPVDGE